MTHFSSRITVFQFYLEDMEGLKLDVGTLVSKEIHHELQILRFADVARHHCEVVSVQQQLAKKLKEKKRCWSGVVPDCVR